MARECRWLAYRGRHLPYLSFGQTAPSVSALLCGRKQRSGGWWDHVPKAIALIVGSGLGPEALSAARQAFDNAWAEVAGKFYGSAQREAAQLTLATAILAVATNESPDVEILKQAGLQALAQT